MKIQIDTENKTITLLENVEAGEFATFLSTHGLYDWTIIANYAIKVPTEDKSLWKELRDLPTREFKDFTNPLPNPYVNPILPYTPRVPLYPHGTGDPILWCGEGTTQGIKIGEGGIGTTTTNIGNDLDVDKSSTIREDYANLMANSKTHKYVPK